MFTIEHHLTNLSIVFKAQPISPTLKSNPSHAISTEAIVDAQATEVFISGGKNNECLDWNETVDLSPPKLPWHDPVWSIELTLVISAVDVYGRIQDSKDWVSVGRGLKV